MKLTAAAALLALAPAAFAAPSAPLEERTGLLGKHFGGKSGTKCKQPSYFTSAVYGRPGPGNVVNQQNVATAGQPGAYGHFCEQSLPRVLATRTHTPSAAYFINSDKEIICYDIRTVGVTGEYDSPAVTATHIHEGGAGVSGPPRIAFPNPQFTRKNHLGEEIRESKGCLKGPFRTGVAPTGTDTGSASGFTLRQLEQNPGAFFTDTHTQAFSAGAIRAQLQASEVPVAKPRSFSHKFTGNAVSSTIINPQGAAVAGQEGATGKYTLRINEAKNILCYDVELKGVTGEYYSLAKTATHTHRSAAGAAGPPVIAFKNPQPAGGLKKLFTRNKRYSSACVKGPFTSGSNNAQTGLDTSSASGFTLQEIIANPPGFAVDTHTEQFVAGAVRGQLQRA